jgi:hypothetical protein
MLAITSEPGLGRRLNPEAMARYAKRQGALL